MIVITAGQVVAARFSLRADLPAIDIASLRFVGAGAVFLPLLWWTGLASLKALGWRRALVLTLLVGLPYPIIINWGLTYAPATHAAAICPASIVFCSFVLARFAFNDRITRRRMIGIALIIGAFVGIAAFFGALMNWNYIMAGAASTNGLLLVVAVLLVLAWKVAGYYGADFFLLRWLGVPWQAGGETMGAAAPNPSGQFTPSTR
jgi:drug/metabolite transporter (DMT)-like permease